MKRLPFTVIIPPVLPCQKQVKHELMVQQDTCTDGINVLTADSMRIIEQVQMQGQMRMLYEAVQILHETINQR